MQVEFASVEPVRSASLHSAGAVAKMSTKAAWSYATARASATPSRSCFTVESPTRHAAPSARGADACHCASSPSGIRVIKRNGSVVLKIWIMAMQQGNPQIAPSPCGWGHHHAMRFVIVVGKERAVMWKTTLPVSRIGRGFCVLFRVQGKERGEANGTELHRERHPVAGLEGAHPASSGHVHRQARRRSERR